MRVKSATWARRVISCFVLVGILPANAFGQAAYGINPIQPPRDCLGAYHNPDDSDASGQKDRNESPPRNSVTVRAGVIAAQQEWIRNNKLLIDETWNPYRTWKPFLDDETWRPKFQCHRRNDEPKFANIDLSDQLLRKFDLRGVHLARANLRSLNPVRSEEDAKPLTLNLAGACLRKTNLRGANLRGANLSGANLYKADLAGADLAGANLTGAVLDCANLHGANLEGAVLVDADLYRSNLERAYLAGTDLQGADFEPVELPLMRGMINIKNLHLMTFSVSEQGLTRLRKALEVAGMRDQERAVTFALKRSERREKGGPIDSAFSYVLFELTSGWGYRPWLPLVILVGLIPAFAGLYKVVNYASPRSTLTLIPPPPQIARDVTRKGLWVMYFSLLSAFHIGWRDLNVGTWITQMQPCQFTLQADRHLRLVSGIQSLVSVFLLALWALTYFGRPFT